MIRAAAFPVPPGTSVRRLADRFEHFLDESEHIVPKAAEALSSGRLDEFARLAARSQEQAERLLGNQVPETVFLAATATKMGALAASAFGGGFGGSVWAMVPARDAAGFESDWRRDIARLSRPTECGSHLHGAARALLPSGSRGEAGRSARSRLLDFGGTMV